MKTPFTTAQFLDVFRTYNESIYPLQIVFILVALLCVFLVITGKAKSGKFYSLILAFFWVWMGAAYHMVFFSTISKMAYVFGAAFILQGVLLMWFGVIKEKVSFRFNRDIYGTVGLLFILYSLVVYPLLGSLGNHAYPYAPTFGLPCPTTIFTFGFILLSDKKIPLVLLAIPFVWSLIGISAAVNFGIPEDWGLIVAGFTTLLLTIIRNRKLNQHTAFHLFKFDRQVSK